MYTYNSKLTQLVWILRVEKAAETIGDEKVVKECRELREAIYPDVEGELPPPVPGNS